MIIPLLGIISHTRSKTQSRIRGVLAGFNRGIKCPINLSAFTAHIRLNMDGLKYLVFHPSRVSPCLGSWAFQWGHFFSEMDSTLLNGFRRCSPRCFNGATSSQKWIEIVMDDSVPKLQMLFQWGHFFSEMDRSGTSGKRTVHERVSMGPLLLRNG